MAKANQTINVRTWSKTVPSYGLRLSDLDLYVLKNHDDVLRVLGYERIEGPTPRAFVGWAVHTVFLFALVGGVSTLGGDMFSTYGGRTVRTGTADPLDNDLGVPLTSWCFVVVLVGVLLVAYRWLRTDRHRNGLEIGYLVATVACGALALGQLVSERGVDALAAPSLPVWAAAVLAAVLLAAVLLFSRGRRVPIPNDFRRSTTLRDARDPRRVTGLIEALDAKERDKLVGERRRAIQRLRERGLIDTAQAAELESLPLGASIALDSPPVS